MSCWAFQHNSLVGAAGGQSLSGVCKGGMRWVLGPRSTRLFETKRSETNIFDFRKDQLGCHNDVQMHNQCACSVGGFDPNLLAKLPFHLCRVFPCKPEWVRPRARLQMNVALSKLIEQIMVATSSVEFAAEYLRDVFSDMYNADQASYYSRCIATTNDNSERSEAFLTFKEWVVDVNLPSPERRHARRSPGCKDFALH
jgi:hypothetical protein